MSILFSKKTKGTIKWIWGGFAVLIILSMVLSVMGGVM
jgi:hypothetical protein